jgi:hypothetical protein
VCGNDIDEDCDGFANDQDCDGHDAVAHGGHDCNDGDPDVHPGAPERCNAFDDDCDGVLSHDADGDGFADEACGGDDCDDSDAGIHPGALDVCGDGVDLDCNHNDAGGRCFGADVRVPSDLVELSACSYVSTGMQITTDLTDLPGLECIGEVSEDLVIWRNTILTNLDGLSGLTSVGSTLNIESNDVLTNLDGLSRLTSVGRHLYVTNNPALTNLDGLNGLESVGGNLNISGNSVLPTCAADALVGRLRALGWDGVADISGNDTGTCP